MLKLMYKRSIKYFSNHVSLNAIAHTAGGFGLAIVLQKYLQGNNFLYLAWALIALSAIIHIRSFAKP